MQWQPTVMLGMTAKNEKHLLYKHPVREAYFTQELTNATNPIDWMVNPKPDCVKRKPSRRHEFAICNSGTTTSSPTTRVSQELLNS